MGARPGSAFYAMNMKRDNVHLLIDGSLRTRRQAIGYVLGKVDWSVWCNARNSLRDRLDELVWTNVRYNVEMGILRADRPNRSRP